MHFNCTAHNGVLIDNKVFVLYCHKCRGESRGRTRRPPPPPLKLEKLRFFRRNTPTNKAPPSARCNFF